MISSGVLHASEYELSPIETLGEQIFLDENLSKERNQACVSCHAPEAGCITKASMHNGFFKHKDK